MIKYTLGAFLILVAGGVFAPTGVGARTTWTQQYAQAMSAYEAGDYDAAHAGFQRLADFGSPAAEAMLGHIYLNGLGVPKKEGVAAVWYFRSAQKGYVNAQLMVGSMFATGRGFKQHLPRAYFWYEVARLHGDNKVAALAASYQKQLETKISVAAKTDIQTDARSWRPNAATPR
jgi:TPR repeat protein